jgi:N,N'-diacetyllegionaminate synthase
MNPVLIIAEAGVNHNGSLEMAKALIAKAAAAGADIVKFQTFKADSLVSKTAKKAAYQIANMQDGDDTQYEMLRKLEIPESWYPILLSCCAENGIQFLSTGFDEASVDFLEGLNPPMFKIPSGEITNKPYLQHVARKRRPIILSTGMADIEEVKAAVAVILNEGIDKNQLTVLHCNTEYPTPMEDVNLRAMLHIQRELGVKVGYSDHTLGIEVPIAAVALGATVIEKHFTLDRTLSGPDHKASLEPQGLKDMIHAIRNITLALGDGLKRPSSSEKKNIPIVRKSLVAMAHIQAGELFTPKNVIAKRPGTGISPMFWDEIIGKPASQNYQPDELIQG